MDGIERISPVVMDVVQISILKKAMNLQAQPVEQMLQTIRVADVLAGRKPSDLKALGLGNVVDMYA